MQLKRISIYLMVLFFALVLTACGAGDNSNSNQNSSSNTAEGQKDNTKKEVSKVVNKKETEKADYLKEILPTITENHIKLSDKSYDYIVKNYKWFPAKENSAISSVKKAEDSAITIKHLNKNATPYLNKIVSFTGTVVSVEESDDSNLSLTHVMTDDGDSFQIIMFKSTKDILEDDRVQFWGEPLGASSFENVSGGTTNVQVIFGSHMQKL